MRLIGFRPGGGAPDAVGVVIGDQVHTLATKPDFWDRPQHFIDHATDRAAGAPSVGVSMITQVPIVPASARVLCVGLNYRGHAAEGGFAVPDAPTIFGRWTASLSVGDTAVAVPANEDGLDWEGEVAAYLGAPLAQADPDSARRAVLGYSTFNDLTARRAQKLSTQWTLGKNVDRSGPLGPLVTADEVGDLRDGLRLRTRVNGIVVQEASTASMIFDVGQLLSLISQTMTLHAGDVIATGTPQGVGYVRQPPWLLHGGDIVEVEVDRLGTLRTPVEGSRE